ncbi:F0-ATPase subunit G [Schizosaccharomyces cryophilus OY26]|uniref:F0-ATPase subunit G n=1 Tax=Schizosaccharomyces cryophilus (strain OY26 / ATCC MYA-4695 / CBS 11777 / NBRC 106824 / NRRL Y48691) TaxID=653667 RepID=S9W2E0_SCHCR|nr:F0-ATPase subunit G [Schizosaccharomyces cryophilus OY26]EPY54203.1 F0-ATPase subunit G [Schizosaccharomyces cryophilus OY26]
MIFKNRAILKFASTSLKGAQFSTKTAASQAKSRFQPYAQKLADVCEPVTYWTTVGKELFQQVYHSQKMANPSNVHSPFLFWKSQSSETWGRNFYLGVELLGIFSVGQMIGRRKVTSYGH